MCLPTPPGLIKIINQQIFRFLWAKRDMIKRKALYCPISEGGLKIPDIQTQFDALKASWINRIFRSDETWTHIPKKSFKNMGCYKNQISLLASNFIIPKQLPEIENIPPFYQEMITSYNKAKLQSQSNFVENILDQPLWGNTFITHKHKTIWFKNWISSGILTLRDLKIQNEKLDQNHIYNTLKRKTNFFSEFTIMREALSKFTLPDNPGANGSKIPIFIDDKCAVYEMQSYKTKFFYDKIIENVHEPPSSIHYWNVNGPITLTHDIFKEACVNKIQCIKDKKLAETNFKILHNILPCNFNLFRWRLVDSKSCKICGESETIIHLIFECCYAKKVWKRVENILGIKSTLKDILFGFDVEYDLNFVLSTIVFCIYKEWLICSLDGKLRKQSPNFEIYKNEIRYRKAIYERCKLFNFCSICQIFEKLIHEL